MDDTPQEVMLLQYRIWREKSFGQRMKLGADADALGLRAARRLAEKQSAGDPAALFLCLYGKEFEPGERERIATAFRRRQSELADPSLV
jgi:hypothetical protein